MRRIALGTAAVETNAGEWLFSHCAGVTGSTERTTNDDNLRSQTVNPLGKTQSDGPETAPDG